MPWKDPSVEQQVVELILAAERGDQPVAVLCRAAGISRKTFYKWRNRWRKAGLAGLVARSSRPGPSPRPWPPDWEARVLALRGELLAKGGVRGHGARKIHALLRQREPLTIWPSVSTIERLLERRGVTASRRTRPRRWPVTPMRTEATRPMQVMTLDFKGTMWLTTGARADVLTVLDTATRTCLLCQILAACDTAHVAPRLDQVFQAVGLPEVIRTDNGPPFASGGLGGLTPLSLRWWQQGIRLERIAPGCPQQNGVHEHFHRSLKAAVDRTRAATWEELQARCDAFVPFYNAERPHEALGLTPPLAHFQPSSRVWVPPAPFTYAPELVRRAVRPNGYLPFRGRQYYVSETLRGQRLALTALGPELWTCWLGTWPIALLDQGAGKLRPHPSGVGPPGGAQP